MTEEKGECRRVDIKAILRDPVLWAELDKRATTFIMKVCPGPGGGDGTHPVE